MVAANFAAFSPKPFFVGCLHQPGQQTRPTGQERSDAQRVRIATGLEFVADDFVVEAEYDVVSDASTPIRDTHPAQLPRLETMVDGGCRGRVLTCVAKNRIAFACARRPPRRSCTASCVLAAGVVWIGSAHPAILKNRLRSDSVATPLRAGPYQAARRAWNPGSRPRTPRSRELRPARRTSGPVCLAIGHQSARRSNARRSSFNTSSVLHRCPLPTRSTRSLHRAERRGRCRRGSRRRAAASLSPVLSRSRQATRRRPLGPVIVLGKKAGPAWRSIAVWLFFNII